MDVSPWPTGLSGAASFWWWETLDKNNAYPHYRPLAAFLADMPFTTAQLQAVALPTTKQCRVLAWKGKDRAYCWIFNRQATWWNRVAEKKSPAEVTGDAFSVEGLEPGSYRVEWWDTATGGILKSETIVFAGQGQTLSIPAFTRDLACKIEKATTQE